METWLPAPGFEGYYEVSDLGRVRNARTGLVRKQSFHERYPTVSLKVDGKGSTKRVHVLVAVAFLGPRPDIDGERVDVCHNNNDTSDARATNLRYDTHRNNQRQMVDDGRHPARSKTHCKSGHEFTDENTWWHAARGSRQRVCRACHYERRATSS